MGTICNDCKNRKICRGYKAEMKLFGESRTCGCAWHNQTDKKSIRIIIAKNPDSYWETLAEKKPSRK